MNWRKFSLGLRMKIGRPCCIFVLHRGIKLHFFLYNATQMNIIVYSENNVFTGNLVNQGFPHDMYNGFESRLALFCCLTGAL